MGITHLVGPNGNSFDLYSGDGVTDSSLSSDTDGSNWHHSGTEP
jgi:hypothetical protein